MCSFKPRSSLELSWNVKGKTKTNSDPAAYHTQYVNLFFLSVFLMGVGVGQEDSSKEDFV